MSISNKARGKYLENKITNSYRKIFNLNEFECYRAGSSGARTSIEYNGDISFSNPNKYNLITECKYYSNLILNDFFPNCNSFIEKWLAQINIEKQHYIDKFNKIPLTIIIASKPHGKYHLIVENIEYIPNENISYIKFFSTNQNRSYYLIDFEQCVIELFKQYNLL